MSNPIKTVVNWLLAPVFGTDPIELIAKRQADIRRTNARAAEKVSLATLDIEDAVDFEIDTIRASVAAGFARIDQLVATNAVSKSVADALAKASKQIDGALTTLDAAI